MDNSESVLTQEEAQVLALACLTKRWPGTLWRIHEDEALDRGFGWVFNIEAIDEEARIEHGQRMSPHLVLVNKRSRQVVTSRRHTAVGLAKDYEVSVGTKPRRSPELVFDNERGPQSRYSSYSGRGPTSGSGGYKP